MEKQVFTEHNEEQRKLVGKGLSKATYWVSEYTYRLLKEFVEQKYKRSDLFLRDSYSELLYDIQSVSYI